MIKKEEVLNETRNLSTGSITLDQYNCLIAKYKTEMRSDLQEINDISKESNQPKKSLSIVKHNLEQLKTLNELKGKKLMCSVKGISMVAGASFALVAVGIIDLALITLFACGGVQGSLPISISPLTKAAKKGACLFSHSFLSDKKIKKKIDTKTSSLQVKFHELETYHAKVERIKELYSSHNEKVENIDKIYKHINISHSYHTIDITQNTYIPYVTEIDSLQEKFNAQTI